MNNINETVVEVLRLDAQATPGPWDEDGIYVGLRHLGKHCSDWYYRDSDGNLIEVPLERDAALIAYCRTAAPALAREVQRLQGEIQPRIDRSIAFQEAMEEAEAERDAALAEVQRLQGQGCDCRFDRYRTWRKGHREGQEAMREQCMAACSELILRARVCAGDDEGLRDLRCLESHLLQAIRALEVEP